MIVDEFAPLPYPSYGFFGFFPDIFRIRNRRCKKLWLFVVIMNIVAYHNYTVVSYVLYTARAMGVQFFNPGYDYSGIILLEMGPERW